MRGLSLMRSSVRAVIVEDGKLLCVKLVDCLDEGQIYYYMLPGGEALTIENMLDAVKRHCLNKLNLKVKVHDLLFVRDYESHQYNGHESHLIHETEHIFLCHVVGKQNELIGPHPDCNQIGVEWIPIRELTEYEFSPPQLSQVLWSFCRGDDVDIYLNE